MILFCLYGIAQFRYYFFYRILMDIIIDKKVIPILLSPSLWWLWILPLRSFNKEPPIALIYCNIVCTIQMVLGLQFILISWSWHFSFWWCYGIRYYRTNMFYFLWMFQIFVIVGILVYLDITNISIKFRVNSRTPYFLSIYHYHRLYLIMWWYLLPYLFCQILLALGWLFFYHLEYTQ